ncbi:hypothetical protein Tco_0846754 [Tanacetum coccineum]
MSSMNINQYHTDQGESSSRSRPARLAIPFPSCIHCGYNDHKSDDCDFSLRRGIKPRNPQYVTKNCEPCGSNVHTKSDHNDIEWFRKREALQAKKVESFKASKTESLSALRSKTPTKRSLNSYPLQMEDTSAHDTIPILFNKGGIWHLNTLIVPPNMLGPDLNGRAVNESQYKGFDLKGYSDSDCIGCNMDRKSTSADAEYVAATGCLATIIWIKESTHVYDIIMKREVGVNTFRNAIGAHYLPHSSEYVAPPSIDIFSKWFPTIRYGKKFPPKELSGRASFLLSGGDGELILYPTQVFSANNWALKPNQPKEPLFTYHMLAICSATELVVFKSPKPSSNAERVPQGTKPGAKPGHKKHSTSSKQPSVSSNEATKCGSSKAPTSSKTRNSKKRKESSSTMESNPS